MQVYYIILEIFYYLFTIAIIGFIGWNVFKDRKITDKVIGGLALLMFVMRIFMIR